ncbi:MAG: bifunctional aspartate kinase/diaminopimelate decarboxylase [Myxococcota bacterium]
MTERPWVVLKFGGTSVSSMERWSTIAKVVAQRQEAGERVFVVCSAVSQVSNLLERCIELAPKKAYEPVLEQIVDRHEALAAELGVDLHQEAGTYLHDLSQLLLGASLLGEVSPRQHARIMSAGELLSTSLGAAWMRAQGVGVQWLDARDALTSEPEPERADIARFLEAHVSANPDAALQARVDGDSLVLTQGFIARSPQGATVLLGRGGSDTSAAVFAARLRAVRCEIWTDVPGLFTANPRQFPEARLIRRLGYAEAQELASMGAKVLHPGCLAPAAQRGIPLEIRCTPRPDLEGTRIEAGQGGPPRVHAISAKTGVTLVRMDTVGMWQQVGFLSNVFACFAARGLSVDLVSTSETNVTVSLDPVATSRDPEVLAGLLRDLSVYCSARTIGPCAAVSMVGRHIRALLHRLGPALSAFEEHRIHLVTQAASDLNLTVVVDEAQAERLVASLHSLLFEGVEEDDELGPTWTQLQGGAVEAIEVSERWWQSRRDELLTMVSDGPRYVIHGPSVDHAASQLLALKNVDRLFYAMKANPHPQVMRRLFDLGVGFECVSSGEVQHVFNVIPEVSPDKVLFTPNFAHRDEYVLAFEKGVRVGLDAAFPLQEWPEVFAGRSVQLRIDPGSGKGHHEHVRTAGSRSKFGLAQSDIPMVLELAERHDVTIVGLHAHAGSGIRTPDHWAEVAVGLATLARDIGTVKHLDLGGGLGVPEKPGQRPLDLQAVDASLAQVKLAHPGLELWLEPGRYLVATAGVLLARVTQRKQKADVTYVGVETGMNSLIRPALYGAWHDVVNLTRWGDPVAEVVTVVGPICESADTLGRDRALPRSEAGDVLLIDVTGAYGSAMGSHYNLRPVADEQVIDS